MKKIFLLTFLIVSCAQVEAMQLERSLVVVRHAAGLFADDSTIDPAAFPVYDPDAPEFRKENGRWVKYQLDKSGKRMKYSQDADGNWVNILQAEAVRKEASQSVN